MFDPFGDLECAGYLRNTHKLKDPQMIKHMEHHLFVRNFGRAQNHLSKRKEITYDDFLKVHQIIFAELYPWAGQDRATLLPNRAVHKADVAFAHPNEAQLAVNEGLRLGQMADQMKKHPGAVMGLFAFGHPFLDGNGRTMLMVHLELAHRAGFSIAWEHVQKDEYLRCLSSEIKDPSVGELDTYLRGFIKVNPR